MHPSVHRPGVCLQRLQSADDQADRHHAIGARTTGSSPNWAGSSRSRSSSSAPRRPCSAAGSRKAAARAPCSPRVCAWAAAFSSPPLGVYAHHLWIIYLGYGVLGGSGLGLGYISPVSTLIKWFPDRPGMATGMAIMGFGGGAFIASPLSVWLMQQVLHAYAMSAWLRPSSCLGVDLSRLHVGRRGDRARSARRLEAGGLHAAGAGAEAGHHQRRLRLRRAEDAAVLADLGGAVPQRHRRHRRARPGLGDEPGDVSRAGHGGRRGRLRRLAQPVQHGAAGSSGPRPPTISAARTPTSASS